MTQKEELKKKETGREKIRNRCMWNQCLLKNTIHHIKFSKKVGMIFKLLCSNADGDTA